MPVACSGPDFQQCRTRAGQGGDFGRKRRGRGFDVLLTAIASLLLFDWVMWYFGVARGQCRGLGQLRPLFYEIDAVFKFDLLGIPYVVLTGATLVAARKGALGGRFGGSLALIIGAIVLLQPPATIQGDINAWRCYPVDYSLPWRIGLGALWTGLGLALFLNRRWTAPGWMTRAAGVLLLLVILFDTVIDGRLFVPSSVQSGDLEMVGVACLGPAA